MTNSKIILDIAELEDRVRILEKKVKDLTALISSLGIQEE